ncbi:hypothetical protein AALA61_12140 [Oscillospiraceae bacterium 42-9]
MAHSIRTVYVVHHSHTDIGYTDLQERVVYNQVDYIRTVLGLTAPPNPSGFRWNCETLFCVEKFFQEATPQEQEAFCRLAAKGEIGLSASYLNFTDLMDTEAFRGKLNHWHSFFAARGADLNAAMIADINGVSMGFRDALLENGVKFLFANIHCHHGMYPLFQNQTAFWWENAQGQRLLVWNGDHYNLGNVLGFTPNRGENGMIQDRLGEKPPARDLVEALHDNLEGYLDQCEAEGYPYSFLITAVSGVFSDNAPPEGGVATLIEAYNKKYGQEVRAQMVSLQELYALIREPLADAPVYRGDLTDWWANGVGSTPYEVKHYREAQQRWRLCRRLDPSAPEKYPDLWARAQDNLLLYAEHTWGHSSTISNPCDAMVRNLDLRKTGYACQAHQAASSMLNRIAAGKGDCLRYYAAQGKIRAYGVSQAAGPQPVEFYLENHTMAAAEIRDQQGSRIPCQVSPHPRGRMISFLDTLAPGQEKTYTYRAVPVPLAKLNPRKCYVGSEQVRDIVNDYDPVTYTLPYGFENQFFRLSYRAGQGITSLVDKRTGRELLGQGEAAFFTPLYEHTPVREGVSPGRERSLLGRNIRGQHARLHVGELVRAECQERGPVFTLLRLEYRLPGTIGCQVYLKFYQDLPRIDYKLETAKTLSRDIESVFLPLSLNFPQGQLYLRKGTEAFRPGVDQIPGTCMEYYMTDHGLAYVSPQGGALISTRDVPLVYMGEMRHHPIRLCGGQAEDNRRPVYSWVMNNTWETNFRMDLSGFGEFTYSLWLDGEQDPQKAMEHLEELSYEPFVVILE